MIDSANVTKKETEETREYWRLLAEKQVDQIWLPWIGQKVREASAQGSFEMTCTVDPWFMSHARVMILRQELSKQLLALGYQVSLEFPLVKLNWENVIA